MSLNRISKIRSIILIPLVSIILAFIIGIFFFSNLGYDPFESYYLMISGVMEPSKIADILYNATPLIFTGLSVAVAFRSGMFNIGAAGQLYFGAFLTALVGFGLPDYLNIHLPFFIMIPLLITAAGVGGALWALVPAILKARGVHEVITTIMMNNIAFGLMIFLVGSPDSPFNAGGSNITPQSPLIASEGFIPTIFPASFSLLHWGFIIGILMSIVVYIILWKTKIGFEGRAVGHNPTGATYGGINVPKTYIKIMLISGALAGFAGGLEVMGRWHRFLNDFMPGAGFDGISVALIGGNHPFGVIFGAILFGWLQTSGQILQTIGVPRDIANTLKGFIVFLVAVPLIAKTVIDQFNKSKLRSRLTSENIAYQLKEGLKLVTIILVSVIPYTIYFLLLSPVGNILELAGFSLNNLIRIMISTTLIVLVIFSYYWLKRNNYKHKSIHYTVLISCSLLGLIEFINLIDFVGQDLMVFGSFALTGIIILYQEWMVRKAKSRIEFSNKNTSLNDSEVRDVQTQKGIRIYLASSIYFLILLIIIGLTGHLSLPFSINLFLFTLDNIGGAIGLFGVLSLIIILFIIRKASLPPNLTQVTNLPYVLYGLVGLFFIQAISLMFVMDTFLLVIMTLEIGAPIGLAALGGMFSEKSGVVNIGLEGMMLTGAFVAVWFSWESQNPWVGVIAAVIAGGLMGLLHALASIRFKADQVVVGVAINIVATALTTLGIIVVWNLTGWSKPVAGLSSIKLKFLNDIPVVGEFLYNLSGGKFGLSPLIYAFILIMIISTWVIQRTAFGLRVRSVGEHPRAADTLGIKVNRLRYICVILSGVLAGLGGAALTVGTGSGVIFQRGMTIGKGFIALAALIFGAWSPIGAALASLVFSFATAFRLQLDALGYGWIVWGLRIEKLTPILPYLITLISVAIVAKRMRPPAADGIPYEKEG